MVACSPSFTFTCRGGFGAGWRGAMGIERVLVMGFDAIALRTIYLKFE
jgi:hypothetical protein